MMLSLIIGPNATRPRMIGSFRKDEFNKPFFVCVRYVVTTMKTLSNSIAVGKRPFVCPDHPEPK